MSDLQLYVVAVDGVVLLITVGLARRELVEFTFAILSSEGTDKFGGGAATAQEPSKNGTARHNATISIILNTGSQQQTKVPLQQKVECTFCRTLLRDSSWRNLGWSVVYATHCRISLQF